MKRNRDGYVLHVLHWKQAFLPKYTYTYPLRLLQITTDLEIEIGRIYSVPTSHGGEDWVIIKRFSSLCIRKPHFQGKIQVGIHFLDITAMHWSFVSYKVSFEMLFVNIALALQFILSAKCRTYSYLQPMIQWKSLFLPAISQMWFFCFQNILYP